MITVFIRTVVWYDLVNTRRGLTSMFSLAHCLRRWTDTQPHGPTSFDGESFCDIVRLKFNLGINNVLLSTQIQCISRKHIGLTLH